MAEGPTVSVIMPAWNAGKTIAESLQSVCNQSHREIEIVVIDDGSEDNTSEAVKQVGDVRILYVHQNKAGVAATRNTGIALTKGDYFCFLDADDLMPPRSIESRLEVFNAQPELAFVGGAQEQRDASLQNRLKLQYPNYWGMPLKGLIELDPGCFINCGTWLIRKKPGREYRFPAGWTHVEDLAFFFSIAEDGPLGFTREIAQIYRRSASTAMANLDGLERGYHSYYTLVRESGKASGEELRHLRRKIARIMALSYLADSRPLPGLRAGLRALLQPS